MGIKKTCLSSMYFSQILTKINSQRETHQSVLIAKISSRKTKKNRQSALKKKTPAKISCHMALVPASVLAFFKSPNIHLKILQTELYTFPHRILSWENSIVKDQDIFSFGNHFINSHNLFSDTACNILRRKLMLRPRASFFFHEVPPKKREEGTLYNRLTSV